MRTNEIFFQIKWKGYDESESTWESFKTFKPVPNFNSKSAPDKKVSKILFRQQQQQHRHQQKC